MIALVAVISFFTILGAPLCISLALFIGTRVWLGLGEGVHFPMMNAVTKFWFSVHERRLLYRRGKVLAEGTPKTTLPGDFQANERSSCHRHSKQQDA